MRATTIGSRRRLATLAVAAAFVAGACGQRTGVHAQAAGRGDPPLALSSPNGENAAPSRTSTTFRVLTVTRTRRGVTGGPGPFYICPVQGRGAYSDDFGAPRYAGGFHHHAGNDIFAPMGTPIVAPFDGFAKVTSNSLGGRAVTVYGRVGYVYNAHLAAFGHLGWVKAGRVIGFVGNSGDAAGGPTHDHFEWHPGTMPANPWTSPSGVSVVGGAVDPYPFLRAVC
jgi:murein DD-endopeptidase MepM/ murein hydrolase activator NlpD